MQPAMQPVVLEVVVAEVVASQASNEPAMESQASNEPSVGSQASNEPAVESQASNESAVESPASNESAERLCERRFDELPLFELQTAQTLVAENSLREFQLQNQGGLLGNVNWPELREKVGSCELCKLRENCTHTVFGAGNDQADWMFIGEAPGVDEDATGEPFAGLSGHLLDNMLLSIRLKRSEVYIANVIKCRPPEDRHPHVGEVAACLPYLKRQIDLLKPKLIVALGKTAASALLQTDATIASLRGTLHDYNGIPLVVTFHPAYLLRSPMEKAKAWQDLCLASEVMRPASMNQLKA